MLVAEHDNIFQEMYNRAVSLHPEIKDVLILYNTNSPQGVHVGKGVDKDAGSYRISCEGNDDNPDATVASFALGLVLVTYDIKYGTYDHMNASNAERARFDALFHEFFPDSTEIEKVELQP
jgi:hypothetical protein